ncbi:hypothetical protein ALC57_13845 [Trachymyrmex cornetzi]|uniref:Uncharacterized protein n=1 Tax=Trachymyrmex cornetzi TaxID=471704 RepID=A0A195DLR6_9HYME|nr:hypothetical protein ALC57_13845 [Trachymyrmex cornetzi]
MRSERSFSHFQRVFSSEDHPSSSCTTLYVRTLRARATGAPSLSVTRALPPARWWRSSVLAVRDAEFVEEIQSYCLGSLCRTANARTECARLHPRAARGAPISSLGESSSSRRKGNRDAHGGMDTSACLPLLRLSWKIKSKNKARIDLRLLGVCDGKTLTSTESWQRTARFSCSKINRVR